MRRISERAISKAAFIELFNDSSVYYVTAAVKGYDYYIARMDDPKVIVNSDNIRFGPARGKSFVILNTKAITKISVDNMNVYRVSTKMGVDFEIGFK